MPISLILLIGLLVCAIAAATYALVGNSERKAVLDRATGHSDFLILKTPSVGIGSRIASWLQRNSRGALRANEETAGMLVHAGYEGAGPVAVYSLARIATAVIFPLLALSVAPRGKTLLLVAYVGLAVVIGLAAPQVILGRMARARQLKVWRGVPDALDLLVVCVEAGISLDAAILRVARELVNVHTDLAQEFLTVNRRVNAGLGREQALHGLYHRTGVEELRALASNMVQSEKWGTSIATVLRVYSDGLRLKRKQDAEKKAATAPLRMMIPLGIFIFPTIFAVLLGPAMIKISAMFNTISK